MKVDAYLARIGYEGSRAPNTETLHALQRTHLENVPFDALDCLLGPEPSLDPDVLFDKIVTRRRGGFCFELNGLYALLLRELGFDVTMLAARPFGEDGTLAAERAHMTLLVTLDKRWLTDVGFGASFLLPLDLNDPSPQPSGMHRWRISRDGDVWAVEDADTERKNGYAFTLEPRVRADFAAQCHAYSTEETSGFHTRGPCWKMTTGGWIGVRRHNVAVIDASGYREEPIPDEATWKSLLFEHFGYRL